MAKRVVKNVSEFDVPVSLEGKMFYGLNLDEEQKVFRDAIWNPEKVLVMCNAKAGTGKTVIAVGVANLLYQYGLYNGIVYIVSPTQEQVQGFLPGDQEAKNSVYMQPLYDALSTIGVNPNTAVISESNLKAMKTGDAYIECLTHTYLRGVNFENKVVILDETQNYYLDSLKKVLTRIHDNCKVIVIGHTGQNDIYKNPNRSGFAPYLEYFKDSNDSRVSICELNTNHRGWLSTYADNIDDYLKEIQCK